VNVRKLFKVSLMNGGVGGLTQCSKVCSAKPPLATECIHFCNGYVEVGYFLITGIIFC
jgi:hypothetical protein